MTSRRRGPRLVGRDAELAEIDQLVAEAHLVCVVGPPGVGKTALARAYWAGLPRGRSWFLKLGDAGNIDALISACARAMDVSVAGSSSTEAALDRLAAALRARGPAVLVADGLDSIAAAAAEAITRLLATATELRIVVTSRSPLMLDAEEVLELRPLSLPDGPDLTNSAAVELFIERARAVRPGFTVADEDARQLAALLRRVDGLPLGIELSASRVGVLGIGEILERLERSTAPPLFAALEAAWNLLGQVEQTALARASVFRGGFGVLAAEAVLADGGDPAPVLDLLESLRRKSMLMTEPKTTRFGEHRFFLLESLRRVAAAKRPADADDARQRHAEYYTAFATSWAALVDGERALEAVHRLAQERDNIRAAADYHLDAAARGTQAVENAIRTLISLERLAITSDPVAWYIERLTRALEQSGRMTTPRLVAAALATRATLLLFIGRGAAAVEDYEKAQAIADAAGELEMAARMLAASAVARSGFLPESDAGRHETLQQALADMRRALDAHPTRDVRRATMLNNLGAIYDRMGDKRRAEQSVEEAILCHEQSSRESSRLATALAGRGELRLYAGRLSEAEQDLTRALAISRRFADPRAQAYALTQLSLIALERGLVSEARTKLERALELHAEHAFRWVDGLARGLLGDVRRASGELPAAELEYRTALELAKERGDTHGEARLLAALGAVAAARGNAAAASELLGGAERVSGDAKDRAFVSIERGHTELAAARVARDQGDSSAERALLAGARARCLAATSPEEPLLRIARGRLELALSAELDENAAPPADLSGVLAVVAADGSSFQLPDTTVVRLSRRRALCRVLEALAAQRLVTPGDGLSVEELVRAGWPGENPSRHSGVLRVHNAISTLRKLGLGSALGRREDGYFLDPDVRVGPPRRPA